jgi:DNA repair photolyase
MKPSTFKIREIQAKSILQKSGLPVDWVVNPYTGCRFACKYCYAYFVGRFRHPDDNWGSYVDVKINAPALLKKELTSKLKKSEQKHLGEIFFSSVTDPYQGIEAKYQITRQCLQVLKDMNYQGPISILTKSHLVTRDIDIFKQLKNVRIGLTVTSTGDSISRYLETYAPPNQQRLKALKKLHQAGIKTYAFVGPLLPHFVWREKQLQKLFNQLKQSGVSYIYLEHINLSKYIRDRLYSYLKDKPELLKLFQQAQSPEYRKELDKLLMRLARQARLKLAYQQPFYHRDSRFKK